jgi:hypothetical protein
VAALRMPPSLRPALLLLLLPPSLLPPSLLPPSLLPPSQWPVS